MNEADVVPITQTPTWDRSVPGGAFVFDQPDKIPAIWGEAERVLWAAGEPLLIVAPPGVGKTTLLGQLTYALVGVRNPDLLGLPVTSDGRRVVYLAMDRPAQIARALRRGVHLDWRDRLDELLVVWKGPPPFSIADEPERFRGFLEAICPGVGYVIIDSLKDLSPTLEKPETGAGINAAFQSLVADGIEVAAAHHQRKATGDNRKPSKLADVYGSVWLTAGAGSVLLLWGEAGDPVVELSHLKQPVDTVGPWQLLHDHDTGSTTVVDAPDPLAILQAATKGITARTLAMSMSGNLEPGKADVERARRHLERLAHSGHAVKREGDKGSRTPALYLPGTHLEEGPG